MFLMPYFFALLPKLSAKVEALALVLSLVACIAFIPGYARAEVKPNPDKLTPAQVANQKPRGKTIEPKTQSTISPPDAGQPRLIEPLSQDKQDSLDELRKIIANLGEEIDQTSQNSRVNSKSVEDIKAKLENNSILIYEHLARGMANAQMLESLISRAKGIDAKTADGATAKLKPASDATPLPTATQPADSLESMISLIGEYEAEKSHFPRLESALLALAALLGFSLLEASQLETWAVPQAGLRNLVVASGIGLAYYAIGHEVMFGIMTATDKDMAQTLYQTVLAMATGLVTVTILSDRLSLPAYLFLAVFLGAAAYPLLGQWAWSNQGLMQKVGWLREWGFIDFAGASVIHSFAAWFALAWAFRIPLSRPLAPTVKGVQANASIGLLGLSIVWIGWFGLSLGQPLNETQGSSALAINIMLAGMSALLTTLYCALAIFQKATPGIIYARVCAGTVGGLVAVSAGMSSISPVEAMTIGILAGMAQPLTCRALSSTLIKDDHVAANLVAAHGVCGVLGTLCAGLFASPGSFTLPDPAQLQVQIGGVAVILVYGVAMGLAGALLCQAASKLQTLLPRTRP